MGMEFWNAAFERLGMSYRVRKHVGGGCFYMISLQANGEEYILNSAMSAGWVAESCAEKFEYAYRLAFPEEVERVALKRAALREARLAEYEAEYRKAQAVY